MQKNQTKPPLKARQKEILSELRSLKELVRRHGDKDLPQCVDDKGVLGILRLCPGLSLEKWPQLAEEYGLREWLALPMADDDYPFLEQIQDSLEELAFQTEHDPLTSLYNRRAFDRLLDQEVERTSRSGGSLSVAMLDLDDFKKVNDVHGHPCGDDVLVGLSRILLTGTRRYDIAARLGGEEFALVLPETGLLKARGLLERLLQTAREHRYGCDAKGEGFNVTCSAGLVCYKGMQKIEAADLLAKADKALYEAKASGKNQVVTAPLADIEPPSKATLVASDEKKFLFTGS